jgi:hypothetical protein
VENYASLLYYLAFAPQLAAYIHFFRCRPDWWWLLIITFFGPVGALVYLGVFLLPGATGGGENALQNFTARFEHGRRVRALQAKIAAGEALPYNFYELGQLQYEMGQYASAAPNLEEAVKRLPDNLDAKYYLGRALEKLGRCGEAAQILDPVLAKDPRFKFGEALLVQARCRQAAGQTAAAIDTYRRVLAQSSFSEARYGLAELLFAKGEAPEARDHLEKLIRDAATTDLPPHQRRLERKWARKARVLLTAKAIKNAN